uniref:DUF1985 domain-containing protein n=1 Tax=Brassica oleracea TaxID=3712 RepID=A0A3P6G502_BRAOL|nr:unnamed protein product [Brassica oleracea]
MPSLNICEVFLKSSVSLLEIFQPVRFSLVEFEHLTGLNCEYIKNLDNPAVEVTDELARFWELMAVDIDAGPSSQQIVAACERCGEKKLFIHYTGEPCKASDGSRRL